MSLFIPGPAGRLEALAWPAQQESGEPSAARAAALVAHPHPQYGGSMHNNVVFRIARGLQRAGLVVVRFNFRGVEESEGTHDGRGGEVEDARAVLGWLAEQHPGLPLWAAGFSFGSRTVAELSAGEPRVARLLCVALPCKAFDCSAILRVRQPGLVLQAGNDAFGNLADLRERLPDLPPAIQLDEIEGEEHFFRGATPELEARVRAWAGSQLEPVP